MNLGHLIKERICSHQSKFFPLRVDLIFGSLFPPGKQTGSQENCLPLEDGGVPIHLKSYQSALNLLCLL